MNIHSNISLKPYNTLSVEASAAYFSIFSSVDELAELLSYKPRSIKNKLILGGGSNILFSKNYDGIVLKNELLGIELAKEDDEYYYVTACAGENWHTFVNYCVEHNYAGIENLSLIPGCVGASPIQNIGAYGVEIQDVFESLEAFHLQEKKIITFRLNDCAFGYRDSVFKHTYKNQFAITAVTFRLRKKPIYHTSYGAIEEELQRMKIKQLSIQAISQAAINIRKRKLPDPNIIGNAGSFFKNPVITNEQFQILQNKFPDIVGYNLPGNKIKLAAAWLIEQCGWKGFREGEAGVHEHQALVLVNFNNASGSDILMLAEKIEKSVEEKFGVSLEKEVNII